MRVLVVGGGGREHALVWKLKQSPDVKEIFCAPGNPGIADLAHCVNIEPSDIIALADFAKNQNIGLTVTGPELPLILGLADEFANRNLPIFGPTRAAAEIEGSKAFAKGFLDRHNIPTAAYLIVNSLEEAAAAIQEEAVGTPMVIKADGLAAGKGVFIVESKNEALNLVKALMKEHALGSGKPKVVIEEFLHGNEVSFFVLSDGSKVLPLVTAQDHKKAFDRDEGPNTGGMGCICPATVMNTEMQKRILLEIVNPTISGLADEGRHYQGILYCGLMITTEGPKVLEFNVRFGDPEAQAILPRMKSDLFHLLMEVAEGDLKQQDLEWRNELAVSVVMASGGYPSNYEKGKPITGLPKGKVELDNDLLVFQAGTKVSNGQVVTSGGRVLAVTALHYNLKAAIDRSYAGIKQIQFEGQHFRKDIGHRALAHLSGDNK